MRFARFVALQLGLLLAIGIMSCASGMEGKKNLNLIRLNMSKLEVAKTMQAAGQAKASEMIADGKVKEELVYRFENLLTAEVDTYSFIFVDDRLTKWGKTK